MEIKATPPEIAPLQKLITELVERFWSESFAATWDGPCRIKTAHTQRSSTAGCTSSKEKEVISAACSGGFESSLLIPFSKSRTCSKPLPCQISSSWGLLEKKFTKYCSLSCFGQEDTVGSGFLLQKSTSVAKNSHYLVPNGCSCYKTEICLHGAAMSLV